MDENCAATVAALPLDHMSGVLTLRRAGPFRVEAQVGRGWRRASHRRLRDNPSPAVWRTDAIVQTRGGGLARLGERNHTPGAGASK